MSDFKINDYLLHQEAKGIAKDALDEIGTDQEELDQYIWETCDGHGWVIYTYKAKMLCAHCNTSDGEDFMGDIGGLTGDYDDMSTKLAFATLYTATRDALAELIAEQEAA